MLHYDRTLRVLDGYRSEDLSSIRCAVTGLPDPEILISTLDICQEVYCIVTALHVVWTASVLRLAKASLDSLQSLHTSHLSGHLAPFLLSRFLSLELVSPMSTSRKKKDEKRLLQQHRERILAQLEDVDAKLEQCSDGELYWCGYCIMPPSDVFLR